jgi:exosortase
MACAPRTDLAKPSTAVVLVALVAIAIGWSWWPSLCEMASRWSSDPRYSHGFLVPIFSAYLLWSRRSLLDGAKPRPRVWGLALIAAGSLLGIGGARFYFGWLEGIAPLISLAGMAVLAGGLPVLRWAWPAIAFLIFMVPLPYRLETALGSPLQRAATLASTYTLQTLGLPAVAEGNIILIDDMRIGVVEACNGLGMLLMFFAFATAFALVARRDWWDRIAILLGAAPIAFLANVARIVITGVLHRLVGGPVADAFYHDLAGWLMMPLALVAFAIELAILARLFVEPEARDERTAFGSLAGPEFAAPSVDRPFRIKRVRP